LWPHLSTAPDSIKAMFNRLNNNYPSLDPLALEASVSEILPTGVNALNTTACSCQGVTGVKAEIAECCRRLRLGKNIALISDQVEAESHQEYLLKVLKEVPAYRERKRKNRLIKQAGFYNRKTFDG
jgi:hypothetical protein